MQQQWIDAVCNFISFTVTRAVERKTGPGRSSFYDNNCIWLFVPIDSAVVHYVIIWNSWCFYVLHDCYVACFTKIILIEIFSLTRTLSIRKISLDSKVMEKLLRLKFWLHNHHLTGKKLKVMLQHSQTQFRCLLVVYFFFPLCKSIRPKIFY